MPISKREMKSSVSWIIRPDIRYVCLAGGAADLSKAIQSGWVFALDTPRKAHFFADSLNPKNVEILKKVRANFVLIHGCSGFPLEDEKWTIELARPFVKTCKKAGIYVSFYISITNIFANAMFRKEPWIKEHIQIDERGEWIPYGAALYTGGRPLRYMCCLLKKPWREYVKKKIKLCIEAGADQLMFDNSGAQCFCSTCDEDFRGYTLRVLGERVSLKEVQERIKSEGLNIRKGQIGGGVEEVTSEEFSPALLLLQDFRLKQVRNFYQELKEFAWSLSPGIPFDYEVHSQQFMGDFSDLVGSEDGREPGILPRKNWPSYLENFHDYLRKSYELPAGEDFRIVTNAGLLEYMFADGGWDRPFVLFPHPGVRGLKPVSGVQQSLRGARLPIRSLKRFSGEVLAYFGSYVLGWEELTQAQDKDNDERLKIISRYFAFLKDNLDIFREAKPISNVAVIVGRFFKNNLTFYDRLAEQNIQFDFLIDIYTDKEEVERGYELIMVPGIISLPDELAELLFSYVKKGGNLLVSGSSGIFNSGSYQKRKHWIFGEIFGQDQPPSEILEKTYGKGRAVYLPYSVEKLVERKKDKAEEFFFWTRKLSRKLVEVKGSSFILPHLAITRKGELLIFLVNYADEPGKEIQIWVEQGIAGEIKEARSISLDHDGEESVKVERKDGKVLFKLEKIDTWEVVIL